MSESEPLHYQLVTLLVYVIGMCHVTGGVAMTVTGLVYRWYELSPTGALLVILGYLLLAGVMQLNGTYLRIYLVAHPIFTLTVATALAVESVMNRNSVLEAVTLVLVGGALMEMIICLFYKDMLESCQNLANNEADQSDDGAHYECNKITGTKEWQV